MNSGQENKQTAATSVERNSPNKNKLVSLQQVWRRDSNYPTFWDDTAYIFGTDSTQSSELITLVHNNLMDIFLDHEVQASSNTVTDSDHEQD
jgi:hypothetical protein